MRIGLDLGSRTVKLAALKDGQLVAHAVEESRFEPHRQAQAMLRRFAPAAVAATGYGRHLLGEAGTRVLTEIKAHALGARHLFPNCGTVLDVGGQDSKVIILDAAGRVAFFQMNDKCAAGTGRFLEIMAGSLGYPLAAFGPAALEAERSVALNSMCAVFAESEVVSLKHRGVPAPEVARAIHLAVVERLAAMLERAGAIGELVFSGGVAKNSAVVRLLAEQLGRPLLVPEQPELVGALGAALHAGQALAAGRQMA